MGLNYRDEGDGAPEADACRTESEDCILVPEGFFSHKEYEALTVLMFVSRLLRSW